ncbi:hypothetical protein BH10BAC3_BH10BAC3_05140 [soil metagenome]
MRQKAATYSLVFLLQLFAIALFAQEAIVATPEKNSILLGEPLTVTISITGGQPYEAAIPDTLGRFEVLEKMPPTTKTRNGTVTSTQQIVITSFDSGSQRIPPIMVQGNAAVVSPGTDIMVNTLPADAKTEYGDLKQIIDLKAPDQWPFIVALVILILLSAFFIYRLNKKYKYLENITQGPAEIVSPSGLLQQLELLKTQWLQQQTASMQLGNQLMAILRKFLAGKGINSTSKTGEELVIATKTMYDTNSWQQVVQTIRLCNAMRFGKYQASQPEGAEGIDAFIKAILTSNNK